MTRPTLALKKPVKTDIAAPKPDAPPPAIPAHAFASRSSRYSRDEKARSAVTFLAGLGLPLFQHMARTGVVVPMALRIRDAAWAHTDRALHSKVRRALGAIANSLAYQHALLSEGARRRTVDNEDAGSVIFEHRLFARSLLVGERQMIAADLGLPAETQGDTRPGQPPCAGDGVSLP